MKDIYEEKKNNINNENIKHEEESKQTEEKKNINEKNNYKIDLNIIKDEEDGIYFNAKRSYSCKVGDSKRKKFVYNNDEIKLNLNQKLMCLKTPQIRPKKSTLIPNPFYLGSTSCSSKKSKLYLLGDENIILSEGEEESNENSSDSFSINIEEKENIQNNNNIMEISNEKNNINNNNNIKKTMSNLKYSIEEENDDYNEKGDLILKKLRKNMIQSKKTFSKRIKNNKDLEHFLTSKFNNIKESILNYNEEEVPQNLFKTVGFSKVKKNNLPILNFLEKKSTLNKI